jgi:hypothetical protein
MFRIRLMVITAVAALGVFGATAAAAPAATVQLAGVKTTLTTDPATTKILVKRGILPVPVRPATVRPTWQSGLALRYSFPITGGSVDADTLAGEIRHSGGLRFVNIRNGKSLLLTSFTIDTVAGQLTAAVNGNPAVRVPILNLDLSTAEIAKPLPRVIVTGVGASLTSTAAAALNGTLGVSFFAEGIKLGTADVYAKVATG